MPYTEVAVSVVTRVSVEEFLATPDPQGNFFDTYELHDGEIAEVPGPTVAHMEIQRRLERLLESMLPDGYLAAREFYYTIANESRRADVAVVDRARLEEQRKQVFAGAPEIVIEVLSDSNRAADLAHLRRTCLADLCQQFVIADPFDQVIEVYGRDGRFTQYSAEQVVELQLGGVALRLGRTQDAFGVDPGGV